MAFPNRPDPYLIDDDTAALTDAEAKSLMNAREFRERFGEPAAREGSVTLIVEPRVLEFFQRRGPDWRDRMSDALADFVRKSASR